MRWNEEKRKIVLNSLKVEASTKLIRANLGSSTGFNSDAKFFQSFTSSNPEELAIKLI
jgi:hypothetical protein